VTLNEYADMRPRAYSSIIHPTLADRLGWATFIGTPKGHTESAPDLASLELEAMTAAFRSAHGQR
jgi:hypothetical protein